MMRPTVFEIAPVPTASAPSVAWNPTLGKYHVAIRNADNTISVGTANADGVLNFDFKPLPSGTTATAPAIAFDPVHNRIIIANKGFANTNLYVGSMLVDGTVWSGWKTIAAGTTASPAIAWNSTTNKLQYAVLGSGNTVWVGDMNYNGTSPVQHQLAGTVASAPAIAIDNTGRVQLGARSSTNQILVGNVANDGITGFSGWHAFPSGTTSAAPGIAWNFLTNKLEVVSKANGNNNVFKAAANGTSTSFSGWSQVTGAVSTGVPAAGMNPLLAPLNIFTLNAGGTVSGYVTPAL